MNGSHRRPTLVGVLHLPALPGSPRAPRDTAAAMPSILAGVRADCLALKAAGYDAIILENFGDAPFVPESVEPITIATLTACAIEARRACDVPLGINVLRNDALAALAIAGATGASFVRVNVHVGAAVTDQGILQGRAYSTLRARRAWGIEGVDVWADVAVKHAAPLGERPIEDEVHDAVLRGLATAILVTGRATGAGAATGDIERASGAIGDHDVGLLVASGATPEDLTRLRRAGATGVVVGSWIRDGGVAGGPIDPARARTFATAFRASFGA